MAKSLRSKIMRRWRSLKRGHIDNVVVKQRMQKIQQNVNAGMLGIQYRKKQPKNAFLHPNQPDSQFPQIKPAPIIDLRSTSIPGSGRQWSGAKIKNKTITKDFQAIQTVQQRQESMQQQDQNLIIQKMNKMNVQTIKQPVNKMPKKNKKSKLRKTIVF